MKFNPTEDGNYTIDEATFSEISQLTEDATTLYDKYVALEESKVELEATVAKLSNELETLKVELENKIVSPKEEVKLPTEIQERIAKLEAANKKLELESTLSNVKLAINNASKSKDGKVHSPVLLNMCRNAALGLELNNNSDVIKLEDINKVNTTVEDFVFYLLDNLPRQIDISKLTTDTVEEKSTSTNLELDDNDIIKRTAADLWSNIVPNSYN